VIEEEVEFQALLGVVVDRLVLEREKDLFVANHRQHGGGTHVRDLDVLQVPLQDEVIWFAR
jgi:hypothetical protein